MSTFQKFINQLKTSLKENLPGLNAQLTMAPATRQEELRRLANTGNARQSAVLVFFYPVNGETKLVFIKRPVDLSVHSGQVAFPGGQVEKEDKDLVATALREANEEVNIDPAKVTVVGALSKLHIPPSNFDVYPFIGFSAERPEFKGNEEVGRILEIDVEELLNPDTKTTKTIHHRLGKLVDVPCYFVENEIIWGATAMMVGELLEVIRKQERIS